MTSRVRRFAWLCPGLAVAAVQFDGEIEETIVGGETVEARWLRWADVESECLSLVTMRLPVAVFPGDPVGRLSVSAHGAITDFEPNDLVENSVDLQEFVRTSLAPLPAKVRAEVLDFLAAVPESHPLASGPLLNKTLVAMRDALRECLPTCVVSRDEPLGLAAECLLAIDEHSFYIQGWYRDADATVLSLRAVSPEGSSVELLDAIHSFQRADLELLYGVAPGDPRAGAGFACYFELDAPSVSSTGWMFELRDAAGRGVEAAAPPVISARVEVRDRLLGDVALEHPNEDVLTRNHLFPAISRLQELNAKRLRVERIHQFGSPPGDPEVSIVVPLYRRIDFLEHQLAQFSIDPQMARTDLIYVLDSPERASDLIAAASGLIDLYKVPFRVVSLAENTGFAGANRAGASVSRGRLLLFMNSDVLPERPGWLHKLVNFYDSTPNVGAVGPKLLFEDDSIQHAGLFFRSAPASNVWSNEHFFKGLHRSLPASAATRRVPAVTAACMLVERALYEEVGGFRACFVKGDFEDSDLCLRFEERGRPSWYFADVALYHLEGQSYESSSRMHAWRYNAWLHTYLWGKTIDELMQHFVTDVAVTRRSSLVPLGDYLNVRPPSNEVGDEVEIG